MSEVANMSQQVPVVEARFYEPGDPGVASLPIKWACVEANGHEAGRVSIGLDYHYHHDDNVSGDGYEVDLLPGAARLLAERLVIAAGMAERGQYCIEGHPVYVEGCSNCERQREIDER